VNVVRSATFRWIVVNSKIHHNGGQLNCTTLMETVKSLGFLALDGFSYQENDFTKHISQPFTDRW
jgi:hypothetical protein